MHIGDKYKDIYCNIVCNRKKLEIIEPLNKILTQYNKGDESGLYTDLGRSQKQG